MLISVAIEHLIISISIVSYLLMTLYLITITIALHPISVHNDRIKRFVSLLNWFIFYLIIKEIVAVDLLLYSTYTIDIVDIILALSDTTINILAYSILYKNIVLVKKIKPVSFVLHLILTYIKNLYEKTKNTNIRS